MRRAPVAVVALCRLLFVVPADADPERSEGGAVSWRPGSRQCERGLRESGAEGSPGVQASL